MEWCHWLRIRAELFVHYRKSNIDLGKQQFKGMAQIKQKKKKLSKYKESY